MYIRLRKKSANFWANVYLINAIRLEKSQQGLRIGIRSVIQQPIKTGNSSAMCSNWER